MIVPRFYEDLNVLHQNTMPNRCYYVPASKMMNTLVEKRNNSDRFQLLSGQWYFRYYDSIYQLKDSFYETDYDVSQYEVVTVPGVWQNYGYDTHQYTNIRYPFPFDPPYVPQENPCGTYVYDFEYSRCEQAPRAYLNFEGVDSCFYVWVNGVYVGYSQVSHSTSEFDVTDILHEGENRVAVLVLKWCDGSYLEDQDKFRMSGIFNDVYILKRPENAIFDYFIKTEQSDNKASINIDMAYLGDVIPTEVFLFDEMETVIAYQKVEMPLVPGNAQVQFEIKSPHLWNAEDPYLYTVCFKTEQEVITDRIGIREICIKDKVVCFNGTPIVFRGINRHDSDPVTGFTISIEHMKRDMEMMKLHNFNAIRSSHYPNAPYFYQLCDQYGFMVVAEADNESHGPSEIYFEDDDFVNKAKRWNEPISDNPEFIGSTLDRVQRCVEREKNRPCVVIWSMGNECAYGCTFEEALKWTKAFDNTRLTHFESARYHSEKRKYDFSNLDLFSRMYPPLEEVDEYLESEPDKPFILIEYCHAMGNGPGDLEEYFQKFHTEPLMCGGFVWEWCDHAIFHGYHDNGKAKYYYGGDHGEDVHDSNFCMDGLVYPDRRPHTGLLEYQNVHRPIRVVSWDQQNETITFYNYLDFTNAKDYIRMKYEVNCDGEIVSTGTIEMPSIEPHTSASTKLSLDIPDKGKSYLKIYYYTAFTRPLIPKDHLLGFEEVLLENADNRVQKVVEASLANDFADKNVQVEETDESICLLGTLFAYTLDKKTGMLTRMVYEGEEMLEKPIEVNIWRAPTDNDMYIKKEWYRARYDKAYTRAYSTSVVKMKNCVKITVSMSLAAEAVQRILNMKVVWEIDGLGRIHFSADVERCPEFPVLPRYGLRMFLRKDMQDVIYYGMGPMESYCDKHHASSHGIYFAKVEELHEDYLRPQENGSHYDCSYVMLENDTIVLTVLSEQGFSFNASVYTQEELTEKRHNYELEQSDYTVLCLDYAQNGIGSNSCGPELNKKYRLDMKTFTYEICFGFHHK